MPNSSARVVVDVGTVIAETYKVEALIGEGGMGAVFLASHARLPGKHVAIKLLHAGLDDPDTIARFKREAEIASRLNHPNIVGVHDFNVLPDGTPYLILEYLRGESLAARLRRGPLPIEAVFSIARQVGSALAVAHREGVVHRDLKPQNILLVPTEVDGQLVEVAKVLDFGISKLRGSTTVKTQESTLLGTPQYMAPEQAKGDHANVDHRTDIFALGSIVYEMLAGHPAFSGQNIPEVCFKVVYEEPRPLREEAPSVSADVVATVAQAMAKAPDARFDSVEQFVEKLTGRKLAAVSHTGISLPPPDEAFAKTGLSGDAIAVSTPPPRAPTPLPVEEAVNPQAATQASLPPTPLPTPTAPRRSPAMLVGIALASAALGALVIYLVTRGGTHAEGTRTRGAPLAGVMLDAAMPDAVASQPDAALAEVPDASQPDAAVVAILPDAASAADAGVVNRPPRDAGRVAPVDPNESDAGGMYGPTLQAAAAAYAARDWATAERRVNEVLTSEDAPVRQRVRAHALRGAIRCVARFDEEGASIDLKAIPAGFRALRRQLLDACHGANYLKERRD